MFRTDISLKFGLAFITLAILFTALPATGAMIFVDSLEDNMTVDGLVTLREAIEAATTDTSVDGSNAGNGADKIIFLSALEGGTIYLDMGPLQIVGGGDITFNATLLAQPLVIDAQGASRIMRVQGGGEIIFKHMVLTGGNSSSDGGAIKYNGDRLTLSDVLVTGNHADGNGGGLHISTAHLVLNDSHIRNNTANLGGGGLRFEGSILDTLTIESSRLARNVASQGGGLFITSGKGLFTDAEIDSNFASTTQDTVASFGGGIYTETDLVMLRTMIRDNEAQPGILTYGFVGGMINVGGIISMTECEVSGNSASENVVGGGIQNTYSSSGQGIIDMIDSVISGNSSGAGAGFSNGGIMTLTGCQILNNTAHLGSGGGVHCSFTGSATTLDNCTLEGNSGDGGGAISHSGDGTCDIIDCIIRYNTSTGTGGALLNLGTMTITRGVIHDNTAAERGGGIYTNNGNFTCTDVTIRNNESESGGGLSIVNIDGKNVLLRNTTINDNEAAIDGGGINSCGVLSLDQVTLSGNVAGQYGGAIRHGAGCYPYDGVLSMRQCTVSGNRANYEGGGIAQTGGLSLGGNIICGNTAGAYGADLDRSIPGMGPYPIYTQGYNLIGETDAINWNANDQIGVLNPGLGLLQDNGGLTETMALLEGSPAIDASDTSIAGSFFGDQRGTGYPRFLDGDINGVVTCDIGAFEFSPQCDRHVTSLADDYSPGTLRYEIDCADAGDTVTFDSMLAGQPIFLAGTPIILTKELTLDATGLDIIVDPLGNSRVFEVAMEADVLMIGLIIQGGSADHGGGVMNYGDLELKDCQVRDNTSTSSGGGLANYSGTIICNNTRVQGNHCNNLGGGIYNNGPTGTLLFYDSWLTNNSSDDSGGGLYLTVGASASFARSTIDGNSAPSGGGIRNLDGSSHLTMDSCTLSENTATSYNGGGVSNVGLMNLVQCTFSGNTAEGSGGGLFHATGNYPEVEHCSFSGNHANSGGGIYQASGQMDVLSTIISGNTAVTGKADVQCGMMAMLISGGFNLVGDGDIPTRFDEPSDMVGILDPRLSPLRDNGGSTETFALLFGSAAIDAGDSTRCGLIPDDQRGVGYPRGVDGDGDDTACCDIGALESDLLNFGLPILNVETPVARHLQLFEAQGFTDQPVAGQLDSDVLIVRGLSDEGPAMDFGHSRLEGNYTRGLSSTGGGQPGVYAYETGGGNVALGIQQGEADFTPGAIYIAYRNLTGTQLNHVALNYVIYALNRGDRSSRIRVAYAVDDGCSTDPSTLTYTLIAGSDLTSTETAAASPSWAAVPFDFAIPDLVFNPDGVLYLRFLFTNQSGSGEWDSFGLDDIVVEGSNGTSAVNPDQPWLANGAEFRLKGVYPNPFNPTAKILLAVKSDQRVKMEIFDLAGRRVDLLHDGIVTAGAPREFTIDGRQFSSGVYLVHIVGERFNEVRRAVLVK